MLSLTVRGQPIAYLARYFTRVLRKPVLDETGLSGTFDMQFAISLEGAFDPPFDRQAPSPALQTAVDNALRDHLGLRLESRQGSTTVFVIDSVERPTPD